MKGVVEAVYAGLASTGRASAWQLDWPAKSATGAASTIVQSTRYSIDPVVELLNDQGAVIGSQSVKLSSGWQITFSKGKMTASPLRTGTTVTFPAVDANKISDRLTVRVVSLGVIRWRPWRSHGA